jgi:hypothetical protein
VKTVRSWMAAVSVATGLAAAVPVAAPAAPPSIAVKTCSARFTHGVIRGAEKCLGRGQFCVRAADRQYRRYGFRCSQRDVNGRYHLT